MISSRILVVAAGLWGVAASAASDAIPVNVRDLRIPFTFEEADLRRQGGVAIDLFVSRDGGEWALAQSELPGRSFFDYRAADDGTYAFCVRARTADGRTIPPGPMTAGMTVRVDQLPPQVRLSCGPDAAGGAMLRWSVDSADADVATLRIEAEAADGSRRPVAAEPVATGSAPCRAAGVARFVATIRDAAGNVAEVACSPQTQTARPAAESAAVPNAPLTIAETPRPSAPPAVVAQTPPPQRTPVMPVSVAPRLPMPQPPPAEQPLIQSASADTAFPVPQWSGGMASTTPAAAAPRTPKRPDVSGRHLNTRNFRLGYVLDDVGSSGVSRVAVYITEDGGANWFLYGDDPDRQSPVEVGVPADGQYGFSFRVTSGVGLVSPPPQPNERPDVSLTVDTTPPELTMRPATLVSGDVPQEVLVQWSLSDANLSATPVTVSVATAPNGPWRPVATDIAGGGRYLWRVPQPAPPAAYFRVQAVDRAGNVAEASSVDPLPLDASRPSVRVTEIDAITTR